MNKNLDLALKIKAAAYLEGDFVLRSGKKSKYYLDKYLFETKSSVLEMLASEFAKKIKKDYPEVDVIAAPELGAVAIAAAVSIKTGIDFVIVRKEQKEYGTSKRIEGSLTEKKKVLLLEDILTTAGAALSSAKVIQELGYEVVAILGTIDRLQGAEENIRSAGFNYDCLFTIKDMGVNL